MKIIAINTCNSKEVFTDSKAIYIYTYLLEQFRANQSKGLKLYTTYQEISEATGIKISTVYRRISRLKRIGLVGYWKYGSVKSEVWIKETLQVKHA